MVNLHIEQLLLELPSSTASSRSASEQIVREALTLLAQRLAQAPPRSMGQQCQIDRLHLDGVALESLQGPQAPAVLCDVLYARLMEALQ